MKTLKTIALGATVLVGSFILYNAFLEKEYEVSRTVEMPVAPEEIATIVADFSTWPLWSVWFEQDSTMTYVLGTPHKGLGASYSWAGDEMGEGSMIIESIELGKSMETYIEFVGQGSSKGHWSFEALDNGNTRVTWGFRGEMPFALRWMGARMDQMVGPDFEKGLQNLSVFAQE